MKIAKLILYFNTPGLVDELCRVMPDAIVIDNGSDPDKQYKGNNRCIRQENFGFTKGWNEAVKAVWDEYDAFWLMNSDINIDEASVKRVEEVMDNNSVGILTPSYNCWIKWIQNMHSGGLREIKTCEFTAPVITKEVFENIGWLDERFARGYGVEFDYCYRARQEGFRIYVDDASLFYHKGQRTISRHDGIIEYSHKANLELNKGMLDKYGIGWRDVVFRGFDLDSDFNMNITVYTTIFGNYNNLKPVPAQTVKANFVCITDNPNLKCQGWQTVVVNHPRRDLSPRMRAKYFKIMPWECPALADKDITIYIDGSIEITANTFIEYCIKNLNSDMLLFQHPSRDCIYDELGASQSLKKYRDELPAMMAQTESYKAIYKRHEGLYACGVMVRKNTAAIKKMMLDWWFENIKYSYQDQLSFPVVCKLNNIKPSVFKENQYTSGYFTVLWHDDGEQEPAGKILVTPSSLAYPFKFSVLMPVRNTAIELLQQSIESILNQNYKNFEFVIVDDESEDPAVIKMLDDYSRHHAIRLFRIKHKYLSTALNYGLDKCSNNMVVRMDSDDVAHPYLLKKHSEFFLKYPAAKICGVQINIMEGGVKKVGVSSHPQYVTKPIAIENRGYWFVNHPGVCYKKDFIQSLGAYGDVPNTVAEDYTLWCKVLNTGFTIFNLPDVLINYRILPTGNSQQGRERSVEWVAHLEQQRLTLILK